MHMFILYLSIFSESLKFLKMKFTQEDIFQEIFKEITWLGYFEVLALISQN